MKLLKGYMWELSIHSISQWKKEFRNEQELPVLPYYKWHVVMPYGEFKRNEKTYEAMGTYFFPFALRYFREKNKIK